MSAWFASATAASTIFSACAICPDCGALTRPNILMFGDGGWFDQRTRMQESRLAGWLSKLERPLVIELGADMHIPTVRHFGESLDVPMIRINPTESVIGHGRGVSLNMSALEALQRIERALR